MNGIMTNGGARISNIIIYNLKFHLHTLVDVLLWIETFGHFNFKFYF